MRIDTLILTDNGDSTWSYEFDGFHQFLDDGAMSFRCEDGDGDVGCVEISTRTHYYAPTIESRGITASESDDNTGSFSIQVGLYGGSDLTGKAGGTIAIGEGADQILIPVNPGTSSLEPENAVITVNGVQIEVWQVDYFKNGNTWNVDCEYKVLEAVDHPNAGLSGDMDAVIGLLPITVTDANGYETSSEISVTNEDAAPRFSGLQQAEGPEVSGTFNLMYYIDGTHADAPLAAVGATSTEVSGNSTVFTFDDGTLTVTKVSDYGYSYMFAPADPDAALDREITLTAKDGDADTATLTITLGAAASAKAKAKSVAPMQEEAEDPAFSDLLSDEDGADSMDALLPSQTGQAGTQTASAEIQTFNAAALPDDDLAMAAARLEVENVA